MGVARSFGGRRFAAVALLSVVFSSLANYALARWLGVSRSAPWTRANAVYRRIGPQTGPQVFCAGSSLLVSGLSWPQVSQSLGMGIENWTVAGSSPEVWEVFQKQKRNSNTTIIGVSVYDLNEMRLTPERAAFVPFSRSIEDLWSSQANADLSRRILEQYVISYVRLLYPLAGDADKVLVGLRSKVVGLLGKQASLDQHEGVVVERSGILEVVDSDTNVGDWSEAHALRRLDVLREDNHGAHRFSNGPKTESLRRVLLQAQQQGGVIVVVLPVSQYYSDTFLNKETNAAFEKAISDDVSVVPQVTLVRLDRVPGISNNKHFLDLVHLNASGRELATHAFLQTIAESVPGKPLSSMAIRTEAAMQ